MSGRMEDTSVPNGLESAEKLNQFYATRLTSKPSVHVLPSRSSKAFYEPMFMDNGRGGY